MTVEIEATRLTIGFRGHSQRNPQFAHRYPHESPDVHTEDALSPFKPQEAGNNMEPMRERIYEPRVNLDFGMPASWEDMEHLGLDPLTGEVTT